MQAWRYESVSNSSVLVALIRELRNLSINRNGTKFFRTSDQKNGGSVVGTFRIGGGGNLSIKYLSQDKRIDRERQN